RSDRQPAPTPTPCRRDQRGAAGPKKCPSRHPQPHTSGPDVLQGGSPPFTNFFRSEPFTPRTFGLTRSRISDNCHRPRRATAALVLKTLGKLDPLIFPVYHCVVESG